MISEYRLVILGLGYVGLTLAIVNARAGFSVLGVDRNESIIKNLTNGKIHFHENKLPELLSEVSQKITFSTELTNDVNDAKKSSIYIIAVGTSLNADGTPDYSQIDSATEMIGSVLKKGDIVILRSTVVVGTTRSRVIPGLERKSNLKVDQDFFVSFSPERTVEGRAIEELRSLPQIVSAHNQKGIEIVSSFFQFVSERVIPVDSLESAEMVKLISNTYRDITFAFANAVALVSAEYNIDVVNLIKAANDGYVRNQIPLPSPGVGGYCLTKDPFLFAYSAPDVQSVKDLVSTARHLNSEMPNHVVRLIEAYIERVARRTSLRVGILGLAFKGEPETSDTRYSPSIEVLRLLKNNPDFKLSAYDKKVNDAEFEMLSVIRYDSPEKLFQNNDIVVLMHNIKLIDTSLLMAVLSDIKQDILIVDTWSQILPKQLITTHTNVHYANLSYRSF